MSAPQTPAPAKEGEAGPGAGPIFHDEVRTDAYPPTFRPRHCAGETCLHQHPGEKPWPTTQGRTAR